MVAGVEVPRDWQGPAGLGVWSMDRRIGSVVALGLAACSDYHVETNPDGIFGLHPQILVDPAALQFSELRSGETEVQTFTVKNVGVELLEVSDVVIGSGAAFTVLG